MLAEELGYTPKNSRADRRSTYMTEASEGTLLWEPSAELKENANITRYMCWLKRVATWLAP